MKILISIIVGVMTLLFLTIHAFSHPEIEITAELNTRFDLEYHASQLSPYLNASYVLTMSDDLADDRYGRLIAEIGIPFEQFVRLKEAYLDFYFESVDLRVGYQRIAWGKADGINPSDLFNPIDYTRPFAEDNRIRVPAVRMKYYHEQWMVDAVWVPFFTASIFPQEGDRWAVQAAEISSLPPGYNLNQVDFKPTWEPEDRWSNSEIGIRVSHWSGSIDTSVSYFHGWKKEPFPFMTFEEESPGLLNLMFEPRYYLIDVLGIDFAKDFEEYVFRGEAAYMITRDEVNGPSPCFYYVLGLDTFPSDQSYINLQIMGEKAREGHDQLGMTLSYQYDVSDFSQIELNGIYNFTGKDFVFNPKYTKEVSDSLTFSIGANLFFGPSGTAFGDLADKDFVFLEINKTF